MLRRLAVVALLTGVLVALAGFVPAAACHFEVGVGCTEPENLPFNPQVQITLSDDRTSANADVTYEVTQNNTATQHEQFPVKIVTDFPKESGIDLAAPNFEEKIADLTVVVFLNGASTTLGGQIQDHNDAGHVHAPPADPDIPANPLHWLVLVNSPTPGMPPTPTDIWVNTVAPDGHLRFVFLVTGQLLANAQTADAALQEVTAKFFGKVHGVPFLTNPGVGGDYTVTSRFTAWDDPDNNLAPGQKTVNTTVHIAERVPTTVTISPASQTKRLGENASTTVNVKDQKGDPIVGAKVTWDVQSGPHAGTKCADVSTDAAGNASCSYTEQLTGATDTLRATATNGGQSKSVTATVKWLEPATVTLTPASSTKRVGESLTLTATVKDQDGNAMSGIAVAFARTGANPGSENATTNASGQATHTYTGANAGSDTITATATLAQQAASASASATWYVSEPSALSVSPTNASKTVGSSHTVTATVNDQQGRALAGVSVHFEVTGANAASGDRTTDANGQAAFSYTGSNAGSDTITVTVPGTQLSASASATWSTQQQCAQDDSDCDGLRNTQDNCWHVANPDQADNDRDGFGDACDSDDDNDSLQDGEEAPNGCNAFDRDTDDDGLTDWQEVKGFGTRCDDADTDDDGLNDYNEKFVTGTDPKNPDSDGDGVTDGADNCPRISNADQKDSDGDGLGDRCDGITIKIG